MHDPMRIAYSACPLCDSTAFAHETTGDCSRHVLYRRELSPRIRWMRCASCQHSFTDGYFTPEAAALIFSQSKIDQRVGHDLERQRAVSAMMIDHVLPFAALAKCGIEAHAGDLETLALDRPCDVISLADVLEHMPYPRNGLKAAHRLLADGGIAFISMPNNESPLWRLFNESGTNPYWGELEHYHNFGRGRLYSLLGETGFEPLKYGVSLRYRACMEVIARKAR